MIQQRIFSSSKFFSYWIICFSIFLIVPWNRLLNHCQVRQRDERLSIQELIHGRSIDYYISSFIFFLIFFFFLSFVFTFFFSFSFGLIHLTRLRLKNSFLLQNREGGDRPRGGGGGGGEFQRSDSSPGSRPSSVLPDLLTSSPGQRQDKSTSEEVRYTRLCFLMFLFTFSFSRVYIIYHSTIYYIYIRTVAYIYILYMYICVYSHKHYIVYTYISIRAHPHTLNKVEEINPMISASHNDDTQF